MTVRKPGRVALERALSKLGLASRTEARKLILEGRVRLSGQVIQDPLRRVTPETAKIEIDSQAVEKQRALTIALHKPKGVVTTRSDEKGRPTVFSYLGEIKTYLGPVGRLDFATTGLLLLTNDSRFSAWITDPKNHIARQYIATVRGPFTPEKAQQLLNGIIDQGETLGADALEIIKASGRESHLRITLTEGKNREIRRMLASLGHEVTRLKRISFGGVELGGLELGKWRELSLEELKNAFPGAPLKA